ncbi:MAG: hypothetical protein WCG45_05290 [bacterium]
MVNKSVKNFFQEKEHVPGILYDFGAPIEAESFVWTEKMKNPRHGKRLFRYGFFHSNGGEKCKFSGHKVITNPKKSGEFKTNPNVKYIFFVPTPPKI